jgi:hypothetical protein
MNRWSQVLENIAVRILVCGIKARSGAEASVACGKDGPHTADFAWPTGLPYRRRLRKSLEGAGRHG